MNYGAHVWGQYKSENIKRVIKLQDKCLRILNFADFHEPPSKLYKKSEILKFEDHVRVNNYLYVHDSINRRLPPCLNDKFQYIHECHNHQTRNSVQHCVKLPKSYTIAYGIHSITDQSARAWNYFQIINSKENLHILSRGVCKQKLTCNILKTY